MARKRGAGEAGASGSGARAQARRAEAATVVAPGPGGPDGENEIVETEPEQLPIPNECFEAVASLLEHDTLFRCAEVGPACVSFPAQLKPSPASPSKNTRHALEESTI
jgi:hypothetical protein